MLKYITILAVSFLILGTTLFAQNISVINNYNDWKWDSVFVAKNKYITLAVVPDAAGRVLEYNLGEVPSLWLNPKELGKTYAPNEKVKMNEWRNFGGYRIVPLPIKNCGVNIQGKKANRWPPPAVLGDNPYSVEIGQNEEGSQTIHVTSGVQNLPVPIFDRKTKEFSEPEKVEEQIQYKRSLHIEEGSSLVFYTHTLTNRGSETVKRGIMTTSQHVSRSKPELTDGENFTAYVPFDSTYKMPDGEPYHINVTPESHWRYVHRNRFPLDKNNPEHVEKYFNHGTNWKGEVAPGVFKIHFDYNLMGGFHIVSSEQWVCYVNEITKTVFAKIIEPYDPKLEYEEGVNIAIFNSGMETGYLETEVKTPIYALGPGESFDYKEIHGAAQVLSTPILDVNMAGAVTQRLNFSDPSKLSGQYGVFHEGQAILRVMHEGGEIMEEITLENVNPLEAYALEYDLEKDPIVSTIQLWIKAGDGTNYLLDTYFKN